LSRLADLTSGRVACLFSWASTPVASFRMSVAAVLCFCGCCFIFTATQFSRAHPREGSEESAAADEIPHGRMTGAVGELHQQVVLRCVRSFVVLSSGASCFASPRDWARTLHARALCGRGDRSGVRNTGKSYQPPEATTLQILRPRFAMDNAIIAGSVRTSRDASDLDIPDQDFCQGPPLFTPRTRRPAVKRDQVVGLGAWRCDREMVVVLHRVMTRTFTARWSA